MKRIRLTKEEREIEAAVLRGEYKPVPKAEAERLAKIIERFRKDSVLNMRVNGNVLNKIKQKAKKLGVPYQTLISEYLSQLAGPL